MTYITSYLVLFTLDLYAGLSIMKSKKNNIHIDVDKYVFKTFCLQYEEQPRKERHEQRSES